MSTYCKTCKKAISVTYTNMEEMRNNKPKETNSKSMDLGLCLACYNSRKLRFSKDNLIDKLYDQIDYLKRENFFDEDNGTDQVKNSPLEKKLAYTEFRTLLNVCVLISEWN